MSANSASSSASASLHFPASIADAYDAELGSALFAPCARDLVARLPATPLTGRRILEVACGTGRLTRELCDRFMSTDADASVDAAHTTTIVATDLSEGMLDVARVAVSASSESAAFAVASRTLTFERADAQALPFADASFDLIVAQFGYMLMGDRAQALAEARRVLKPAGAFVFSVWADPARCTFFRVVCDVVATFVAAPCESTTAALRHLLGAAHTMSDSETTCADLSKAGFTIVSVARVPLAVADTARLARGIVLGSPYRTFVPPHETATCIAAVQTALGAAGTFEVVVYHATI